MLEIQRNLTPFNFRSANRSKSDIKYLVIHYTAGNGDTAKGNTNYFRDNDLRGTGREASAHYFVDSKSIWQSVSDKNIAWHCGTSGTYYHPNCRNSNSIGIEICSIKTGSGRYDYSFKEESVKNALELTAYLMKLYNIPLENVIRHYDVTHKICPAPFVSNNSIEWSKFKNNLKLLIEGDELSMTQYEELKKLIGEQNTKIETLTNENKILKEAIGWTNPEEPALYAYNDENLGKISSDANEIIGKLIEDKRLSIDSNGKFAPLSKSDLRLLIILNR